ncbi:MAG TPA: isocitrate lyase/PEP mutase family protein [Eubacteriales bacterium]|nr:isocitrate lyase/PEP mutase family protein [Eubacteriales bacterium]
MEKRKTLRELVAEKQIFAPCVWDVMSARAAEEAGYEATLLSGGALAEWVCGLPDIGLMTVDDLVRATEYITTMSSLPCCVDADDGYGETPLHAYRTTKRLVEAGAMSITLDDTTGFRGYNRWGMELRGGAKDGTMVHPTVSRKVWLAKIKAALEACEGSDCMLIARTECKLQSGLDEAIERCLLAEELGAEMTLIIGLMNLEEGEKVAKYVKGWKMWPDVGSTNGVPDVELDDIEKLGFNFVTMHILEKGAMYGMLDFGKHVLSDKSLAYHDTHKMGCTDDQLITSILGTMRKPRKPMKPDRYLSIEDRFWENLPGEK